MGLANAGIALGLIFGLGCGTYTTVQTYVRTRMSEKFAHQYEGILQSNSLADLLWYNLHPDGRKDQTGEQLVKTARISQAQRQDDDGTKVWLSCSRSTNG